MIEAILTDLDGTLLAPATIPNFEHAIEWVSARLNGLTSPEEFIPAAQAAMRASQEDLNPLTTVIEDFYRELHERLGCSSNSLVPIFQQFYESGLGDLRVPIEPQTGAQELLTWLHNADYTLVVAADPAQDARTIKRQLGSDGLRLASSPVAFISSQDSIHFGKSHPHFYEEILARIDIQSDEALMVGDDWNADMQSAARAGLNTFWVTSGEKLPAGIPADSQGSLADLLRMIRDESWLDNLEPRPRQPYHYAASLLGTIAAIDSLLREVEPELWTRSPAAETWSVRDAICHLRDHEVEVDHPRLRRILEHNDPFISATGYDPGAHIHEYAGQDARAALVTFNERRAQTLAILQDLPDSAWERPARHSIFGPTTFGEMVQFMTEHDRIHLRQMRDALKAARA